MRSRSIPARLLAGMVAVVAAIVATTAVPAQACACGAMVDLDGHDTAITGETVIIRWDGTTETVHLRLAARSDAVDAGLLIPTPAPATASLGDDEVFDHLDRVIRPRAVDRFRLFGPPIWFGGDDGAESGAPAALGVDVIDQVDLGPIQATTLAADDPVALEAWLDDHGYTMSDELADLLGPYVEEGWSYVAIRLTSAGADLDGELPPVVLDFAADELVYPMRLSEGATGAQQVRTFVVAEHRMNRTDPMVDAGTGAELLFAGPVPAEDVTSLDLGDLVDTTPYLTAYEQQFDDPATQIDADLTFAPAPSDETFQRTYEVYSDGIPVDVAALGFLVLVGLAIVAVVVVRRRPRPSAPAGT
ncbi:MAG: DUF2330 domain-containing protein [Acidimicrobiales bacterium]